MIPPTPPWLRPSVAKFINVEVGVVVYVDGCFSTLVKEGQVVCGRLSDFHPNGEDEYAHHVAHILEEEYCRGFGQMVYKQKSAIFFSENCGQGDREVVHNSLQIQVKVLGEKYHGLPTIVWEVSDGVFNYVLDRTRNFICGWSENLLSCAGREVLIKANAQAVPTYSMSCFRLLAPVCWKTTTYISNYWWGSSMDNHKIHWLRWNKLTDQ